MKQQEYKYVKMTLHPLGVQGLTQRSPWAAAWWSVALPGLGHFYLGSFAKGFILISWEIVINTMANLNLAIYYTLIGDVPQAAQVLELKWVVLYPGIYMLAIWDSYRVAVEENRLYDLERLQAKRFFEYHTTAFFGQNMLLKRNPWVPVFWSAVLGGAGHFHNMQLIKGAMLMGWYLVIVIKSSLSQAVVYTLLGQYDLAQQVVDYQWILFWPSIHLFNIWNAYVDCVEQNKLYDEAQYYWLKEQEKPTST
ncbi:MAG: hypothetical protein ACOY94_08215 [Bacillota bacterium]